MNNLAIALVLIFCTPMGWIGLGMFALVMLALRA